MNYITDNAAHDIGRIAKEFTSQLEDSGIYDIYFNWSLFERRGLLSWDIIDTLDGKNTTQGMSTDMVRKFIREERPAWDENYSFGEREQKIP